MTRTPLEEAVFLDREAADPNAPVPAFVALQRVVVRMLFDPAFVARVYADPDGALGGLDLDPKLVRQLLENDRRLWSADRLRRSRALKILMEEFKVATTLVLWETRKLAFLDAFFGSEQFHEAVQRRGYMAVAFARYLEAAFERGTLRSAESRAVLGLEAAMARSRRALRDAKRDRDPALRPVEPGRAGERWVAAPGVMVHRAPGGIIGLVQHVEKYLFELSQVPAVALCDDPPRPDPLPRVDAERTHPFLLEPRDGGKVELSEVEEKWAAAVEACARPVDRTELTARLGAAGHGSDAADIAESLEEAGVLRRVRVGADGGVSAA